jgi:hypothetical protein
MISLDVYPKIMQGEDVILPDETLIYQIFNVTHLGMTTVFPATISKEEDYTLWRQGYEQRIRTGTEYLLLFDDEILKGYMAYKFRYDKQDINVEDLIILPQYQGDGRTLVRLLCAFFDATEKSNLSIIRGHTNKLNKRMQQILSKSGFGIDEYTERGIRYVTTKEQLRERFSNLIKCLNKRDRDLKI